MLYGMGDPIKRAAVDMGCCRIYTPYGDLPEWRISSVACWKTRSNERSCGLGG